MLNNLSIRVANSNDAKHVSALGKETFTETFGHNYSKQGLENYLHQTFNLEKIRISLSKPDNYYLIAFINSIPIGYLKLKLDLKYEKINATKQIQLQKMYVFKEYIGNQIGTLLLQKAFSFVSQNEYDVVWLVVLPANRKGIRFYEKHGFEECGIYNHRFEEFDTTFDVMKKELKTATNTK